MQKCAQKDKGSFEKDEKSASKQYHVSPYCEKFTRNTQVDALLRSLLKEEISTSGST